MGGANDSALSQVEATRILFIGNSYTYCHNLPELLAGIAASSPTPHSINTDMFAEGGAYLALSWQSAALREALLHGQWDYVVLQERSVLGGPFVVSEGIAQLNEPAVFHESVRAIVSEVRRRGTKPVLFMTWAHRNNLSSQSVITKAYRDIGSELGVPVAPVGLAWQEILANGGLGPELYDVDGQHPAPAGSYLSACVIYSTIFGRSPQGAAARIVGTVIEGEGVSQGQDVLVDLTDRDAALLQEAAWNVVRANGD